MAKVRIGAWTLWRASTDLCKAVGKFGPYLKTIHADNEALMAALAAAEAACGLLAAEAYKLRDFGD
jgi:hypothetical protein